MTARLPADVAKWATMPCVGFDLETSGVNPHEDRIVTAAVVDVPHTTRPKVTTWLCDPGVPIPEQASDVHGWTTEKIHAHPDCVEPGQLLFEVTGRIALTLGRGIPIVGMNVSYDLTLLEAENKRHGVDTLASRLPKGIAPIIDVFVLDKHADPYRKGGRKLGQMCATYGVVHTGEHDAGGDALAACRLWPRIIAKHPEKFRGFLLPALHVAQVGWRREQMNSLRSYFDRKGTVHDGCCPEWPVHVNCAPVAVSS